MQATKSSPLIKAIQIKKTSSMSNPITWLNIHNMNPKWFVAGYVFEREHHEQFTYVISEVRLGKMN